MDKLWQSISRLQGLVMYTNKQRKPFNVLTVTPEAVVIRPAGSVYERPIPRSHFEAAYKLKEPGKPLLPIEIQKADASERNASYVAAILNTLLG